jgi:hypothetical protein
MLVGIRRRWRRMRSGFVAAATLAAVAACAVGVPLPSAVLKPHSAERYPCEHHACGCVDAKACWQDCCCMSHGEKLAWAEREGVTPPAFVMAAAALEIIAEKVAAKAAKPACSRCCQAKSPGGAHCDDDATCEEEPASRGVRFVMLHEAMKCRGLTVSVSLLPPSLPALTDNFEPLVIERSLPQLGRSLLYDEPTLAVESPPPDARCA